MVGRGRGRGRGAGLPGAPGAGDASDGEEAPGPPKLFPDIDLPPADPVTPAQSALLTVWTRLETAWRESPCHLAPAGGAAADARLADVLTLHPSLFPAELFSRADADAAAARAGAPGAQAVFWRSAAARAAAAEAAGGALFERLEALERQGGGGGASAAGGGDGGGGSGDAAATPATAGADADDDGAGGAAPGPDSDADEPDADDDYLVGEAFDDDEEYGDDDDGDAEPTY